jgi:hypothetical protein
MEYETKVLSYIVKQKDTPIFDESATTISIDDEAHGEFIVISQNGNQRICFDFCEWDQIDWVVRKLMKNWKSEIE